MILRTNNRENSTRKVSSAAEERQLKKDLARLERQIEKANERESQLLLEQAEISTEAGRLVEIHNVLAETQRARANLEEQWLAATLLLEN